MRKIGLLCLALVLALGALGTGYAAWIDTVVIEQTVNTGSLTVGVFAVAEKQGDEKNVTTVDVTHGADLKFRKDVDPVPDAALFIPGTYEFYDSATIAISNFYPSFWILEDFVIGVIGSVPVRLHVTPTIVDPDGVYEHMDLSWRLYLVSGGVWETVASGGGPGYKFIDEIYELTGSLEGYQLHGCEVLVIYLDKYLQQEAPQGSDTATFTLKVEAIQYNKYDTHNWD